MISGEIKGYMNQPDGKDRFHVGDKHFDFLSKELPEFIQANFPVSDRRKIPILQDCRWGAWGRCCIR